MCKVHTLLIKIWFGLVLLGWGIFLSPSRVQAASPEDLDDIFDLSIEELMELKTTVSSVSRSEEELFTTAASITVLTQEEIHRSGATSIPEVLRMVPGLHVARIDSNSWLVSSRGFSDGEYNNRMLVMIDGRTVYSPLVGGVYWDMRDVMLEDVLRIEVVRGPGGTLWGTNAVNGIISIVTKPAKETQGGLVSVGAGTEERALGAIRHGDRIGTNTHYRVYSKYTDRRSGTRLDTRAKGQDAWDFFQGGFRLDSDLSSRDQFTLQGDGFAGEVGKVDWLNSLQPPYSTEVTGDFGVDGYNLLSRWTRSLSGGSDMALQLYLDHTRRRERTFHERRMTYDLDFQHRLPLESNHTCSWGMGYRLSADDTSGSFDYSLMPEDYNLHLFSLFLQDQIALVPKKLGLTLGIKAERNNYTDWEWQPSARLSWTPDNRHTLWSAVTHAVRIPTRYDNHSQVSVMTGTMGGQILSIVAWGDNTTEAEKLWAYELGYRQQVTPDLSLDITGYYHDYSQILTFEVDPAQVQNIGNLTIFNATAGNNMEGESYGVECAASYEVSEDWKLNAGYSFLRFELHPDNPQRFSQDRFIEGQSPRNQFHLRSFHNLSPAWDLDLLCYYVDSLGFVNIPHYLRVDARVGWKPHDHWELSLTGRNLFDPGHAELNWARNLLHGTEVERALLLELIYRY